MVSVQETETSNLKQNNNLDERNTILKIRVVRQQW